METFTWIIGSTVLVIFTIGIIATIITRVDVIPKWKTVSKILIWVIGLIIFRLIVWGIINHYQKESKVPTTAQAITVMSTVQPKEEWVFSQVEESGRKRTFEVEITKQEPGLLYFTVQQKCGGRKTNMGGLRLNSSGDDWIGTWVNYLDQDHGEATLYKTVNNVWSGHYKLQDGSKVDCTLKRK